jgi:hypothetical protein
MTRTPALRASRASASSNERTAAFEAPYTDIPGKFCSAITPEMPTTTEPCEILRSAACIKKICPNVFVRNTSSMVSIDVVLISPKATMPIALITMFSAPCLATTSSTTAVAESGERRSAAMWFGSVLGVRETVVTMQPRLRSSVARALPSPPVPPATSATFCAKSNVLVIFKIRAQIIMQIATRR